MQISGLCGLSLPWAMQKTFDRSTSTEACYSKPAPCFVVHEGKKMYNFIGPVFSSLKKSNNKAGNTVSSRITEWKLISLFSFLHSLEANWDCTILHFIDRIISMIITSSFWAFCHHSVLFHKLLFSFWMKSTLDNVAKQQQGKEEEWRL